MLLKYQISLIESFYLFYMFNYFKTKISFNHPFEYLIVNKYNFLKHPIRTTLYENKICILGNIVGKIAFIWFLGRYLIKSKNRKYINKLIFSLLFIVTLLLNFNAFIYILPIIFLEYRFSNLIL